MGNVGGASGRADSGANARSVGVTPDDGANARSVGVAPGRGGAQALDSRPGRAQGLGCPVSRSPYSLWYGYVVLVVVALGSCLCPVPYRAK